MQDLEGLTEDAGIYSESPEESLMGFMPENSMIWYVFKRALWLLYREWIWGGRPVGGSYSIQKRMDGSLDWG